MTKILVTGASGFIGSHIADRLIELGYEVRCNVRKTSSLRWLKDKPIELVEASLSNKESLLKAVEGVDYIFHSAGMTSAKNYEDFLKGNRDGTRNLIEAAIEASPNLKRFLHVSSQAAAGPAKSFDNPVTEDMPCRPITSYGRSKYEAELIVIEHQDKLPVTIVRPPAVYGPRDVASFDIFKVIYQGMAPLIGFKPKFISIIHSDDLVRGIIDSAFSEKTVGQSYFISSEEFYDWKQINTIIAKAFNKKTITLKIPHPFVLTVAAISGFFGRFSSKPPVFNYEKGIDFIQNYWICSVDKAKRDFGFKQMKALEQGMTETANWYISNGWLKK